MIKWIPDAMVSLAEEAIRRVRNMTDEARRIAAWLEDHPNKFYRHPACPDAADDQPLSIREAAAALGIGGDHSNYWRAELVRRRLPDRDGMNSLATLNPWVRKRLPSDLAIAVTLRISMQRRLHTGQTATARTATSPDANFAKRTTSTADLGPSSTSP